MTQMGRLTAEQLSLSQRAYDALVWVRNGLDQSIPDTSLPDWLVFDMGVWLVPAGDTRLAVYSDPAYQAKAGVPHVTKSLQESACGTAACIGGSMELYLAGFTAGSDFPSASDWDALDAASLDEGDESSLHSLMNHFGADYHDRAAATAAIDRFLAGNREDPWLVGRSSAGRLTAGLDAVMEQEQF